MARSGSVNAPGGADEARPMRRHMPLICLIALLAVSAFNIARIAILVDMQFDAFLQELSQQTAKTMDERVHCQISQLDAIGSMLVKVKPGTYSSYVSALRSHLSDYKRMGIIAPNDMVYSTSGEPRPLEEFDERVQLLLQSHSGTYGLLSQVYCDEADGRPVIMCAVNMPARGYVPGMLYGVMDMERFTEIVMGDMYEQYVCVTDQDGGIIFLSDSLCEITSKSGLEPLRETLQASVKDNYSVCGWNGFKLTTSQLGFNGWVLTQLTPRISLWDGDMSASMVGLIASLLLLALVISVTSYRVLRRARGTEYMVREAGIDRLTGINNHLGFRTAAEALLRRNNLQRYALVFMRTDVQELMGARYGYDSGRSILEDIARTISAECESGETCARLDGGQFLMLLRFSDTADTLLRIKALNSHLLTLCPLRTRMHYGICVADEPGMPLDQMIERASEAALRVMRKGDLVGLYDNELHLRQQRDEALLNRAQEALDQGEFEVRYRPLRDIATSAIVGAEAVPLWHQPDGSVLAPAEYVPLLTRNFMMGPLNMFVMERVCKDMHTEAQAGRTPERVMINLARDNLVDGMFAPRSLQLMQQYGISGARLEVLLNEAVFAYEGALTSNVISRLHDEGMRVCVSDFGRGSASLRIFSDMPVDAIRLSHEFIESCYESERGQNLLRNLGAMTSAFGVDMYASGPLTDAQQRMLRECGCARTETDEFCSLSEVRNVTLAAHDPFDDWA